MGYYDDVYSSPEKHGLKVVDEIDDPEASYSYDLLVVWQHEDGRLFYGIDSGCSCPSPFELVMSLDGLEEITQEKWDTFAADVRDHCARYDYAFDVQPYGDDWKREDIQAKNFSRKRWVRRKPDPDNFAVEKVELLSKVTQLLRQQESVK